MEQQRDCSIVDHQNKATREEQVLDLTFVAPVTV